jgi:RNA polymerase sigma-70 factor (ECF subfamily)
VVVVLAIDALQELSKSYVTSAGNQHAAELKDDCVNNKQDPAPAHVRTSASPVYQFVLASGTEVAGVISQPHISPELTWLFARTSAPGAQGASDRDREQDRALLDRVAQGDMAALRILYDEHSGRAMAIAMRVLRNEPEAEDVVQETFLEVWRRAAQFDEQRGGVPAWVVTIARSRAIDRLRSTGTTSRAIEAASGSLVPPPETLPSEMVEQRRDEVRVAAALEQLPPEQRQAITLAYFEGLSQSEIAAKTGSPLGTVKMRVKLGMGKLAKLLKAEG